jgi:predicted Zn-dependent peptidase
VDDLVQASHNVIERVKREGVAPGYIEKLKSMRTHDLEDEYRTNHFWLERLVEKFKMKEDPRQILILHDLTNRVTSENIQGAARRCLRDDQYVDARLLPAPKSPPSQGGVHLSNDVEMAEADH